MTLYALMGYPLVHSHSRAFFTEFFRDKGIDAEYRNFETPHISRRELVDVCHYHKSLKGLNMTSPLKTEAFDLADRATTQAMKAGAANVLRIERDKDGRVYSIAAHNTDVEGFRQALKPLLHSGITSALICGTGGAAAAVAAALDELEIKYTFVSRNPADRKEVMAYEDIDRKTLADNLLIVNATPLGTYPNTDAMPPLPYGLLSPKHVCFDLVYNPARTAFMAEAEARGSLTSNGAEMLRLQALASYEFWTGNYSGKLTKKRITYAE